MKERLDLTSGGPTPYPRVRGNLFMAENQGEGVRLPEIPKGGGAPPAGRPPETPKAPAPSVPQQRSPEASSEGGPPLPDTQALKEEYLNLSRFVAKQQDEGIVTAVQPRLEKLAKNLEEQGVDIRELSKEVRRGLPEEALRRGPGTMAATDVSFRERVEGLREQIQRPEFQVFLERIKSIPPDRRIFETVYSEFQEMYQRGAETILSRLAELRRQTPEPTLEISILEQEYNRLREEFEKINSLLGVEGMRLLTQERFPEGIPSNITQFLGRDLIDAPLTDEERKILKDYIDGIEVSMGAPPIAIIELIAQEEELSEKYLDRLLSIPDSLPKLPYSLGFYGNINIEGFLQRVKAHDRRLIGRGIMPPERAYERQQNYANQKGMRERFHEMRRYIIEGNIGNFAEIARTIAPEYLQSAIDCVGVGTIQRFYETAIKEFLRAKQTLEAKDFIALDKRIERRLRLIQRAEFFKGKYNRALEEWEIARALAIGKNYAVIKLRIPELVSLGRVPRETISQIYASFDYESVTRLVNPMRWLGSRFLMGAPHGGQEYLRNVYRAIDETNSNPSQIEKLFGLERTTIEHSVPLSQAGFDTGWRVMEAYFNTEINTSDSPIKIKVSEKEFRDEVEGETYKIWVFDPNGKEDTPLTMGRYLQMQIRWAGMGQAKKENFDLHTAVMPLVDGVPFYRGVLVTLDIPLETKTELWERIARDLPNQIMFILKEDTEGIKSQHPNINFEELEDKLILFQERRVLGRQQSLDINTSIRFTEGSEVSFTDEEKTFIEEIGQLGIRKAEELAKIKWPYAPFLEDGTLEKADNLTIGAEAFRRRIADAVAVHEAGQELLETVNHPDMPFDAFVQHVEKAYNSLSTPLGFKDSQDRVNPFIKARLLFVTKYLWARLSPFIDGILGAFAVPLSRAQHYYGKTGDAQDAFGLWTQTEQLIGKGIVRRHKESGEERSQAERLRKEVGATIWHIARERIPIGILLVLLILVLSLVRSTVTEKA